MKMLLIMPTYFSTVLVICDALDEMDEDEQRQYLLPVFRRLSEGGLRLFLTSRPHPMDVQEAFKGAVRMELTADLQDLRRYLKEKFDSNHRFMVLASKCDKVLCERVITSLIRSSGGMLVYITLTISSHV